MSDLLAKLRKQSTVKGAAALNESKFFTEMDECPTQIPALNIALSGSLTGGLRRGWHTIAAPSRHGKSVLALLLAKTYLDKFKDAILIFADSEGGTPPAYFESAGISADRVLHIPIMNIEELKHELVTQLNSLTDKDKVVIVVDSLGNLASLREVENAASGNEAKDMSRAQAMKSLGRILTPILTFRDIPMITIGHVYQELGLYPKTILSGGTGLMLSSDAVWFMGRQQEKDSDKELIGYSFVINIEKSRHVKEKAKIPLTIKFDGGLSKWSGLLDIALESGHVIKPSNGWYSKVDKETGEVEQKKYRLKDTDTSDFWIPVLTSKSFKQYIEDTYKVSNGKLVTDEDIESAYEEAEEDDE